MTAEERIRDLGIELPEVPAPVGLYQPLTRTGPLLFISGQVPMQDGAPMRRGKCGENVTVDEAADLAWQCSLQALAIVREHLGSLDRVRKVVRVAGYVASSPGFIEHPRVINGASQILVEVFGEAGRHSRIAIGVAELPFNAPVEVEYIFEAAT
jgi:enamine deaminase RidA (YjgF/YER057c/UK114 family)